MTMGRPRKYVDRMKPRPVMLTDAQAAQAAALGDGNLSEGVRKALELAQPSAGARELLPCGHGHEKTAMSSVTGELSCGECGALIQPAK